MATTVRAVPLPGPLDADPTDALISRSRTDALASLLRTGDVGHPEQDLAREMLAEAVAGIALGAYDRKVIRVIGADHAGYAAVVASIVRRSFDAGTTAGRRERIDEQPTVQELRAQVDDATTEAEELRRDLADVSEAREMARDDLIRALAEVDAQRERADGLRLQLDVIRAAARDVEAELTDEHADRQALVERLLATIGGARW